MIDERPEYPIDLTVNERKIDRVIVDQHYREKHHELDDHLILKLVKQLDCGIFPIEMTKGDFEYFKAEPVYNDNSPYRLIFLLCLNDDFIGVVNAFRVPRSKT